MITGSDVAAKALEFVDTPFIYQGRNRNGTDCAGLYSQVCQELTIPVKDYVQYPRRFFDLDFLLDFVEENAKKVRNGTGGFVPVSAGQLLVIMVRGILPHLALALDQDWIVHAYQTVGHVAKTRFSHEWQKDVHTVWEIKGVSYK